MTPPPLESVRDAISRRFLDQAVVIGSSTHKIAIKFLLYRSLYETVMPFLTPDVKQLATQMMKAWEGEVRKAAKETT